MKLSNVIVIDDFYPSLEWVGLHIATHPSHRAAGVNFPGVDFPAPLKQVEFACAKLEELTGEKLELDPGSGQVRLFEQIDIGTHRTFVHVDLDVTMLIYLRGQEGPSGGTVFYRHKEFGLDAFPDNETEKKKLDLLLPYDTNDLEKWEITRIVDFKPNRAVVFPGNRFHSMPLAALGDMLQMPRLTQNFFFRSRLAR